MRLRVFAPTLVTALPVALLIAAACGGHSMSAFPGDAAAPSSQGDPGDAGPIAPLADGAAPLEDTGSLAAEASASGDPDAGALDACGAAALSLDPDATPHTCEVSPADVACDAASDCTLLMVGHCSCLTNVYGVNTASTADCPMPPCPPPLGGCTESGYLTQDCRVAPDYGNIGVACVAHACTTFTGEP